MAPQTLSAAEKQALVLKYFHDAAAPIASKDIDNGKEVKLFRVDVVKEIITNLVDEGQIRMEKIGSSNWYWSFVSEAKKSKERILHDLKIEHKKLNTVIADIDEQIVLETSAREDGDEMILDGTADRQSLLVSHERLLKEIAALEKDLESYSDSDPTEILRKADETSKLKASAEKWTDYIESVEGLLRDLMNDRQAVATLMERTCGNEYVAGEGLREL